MSNGQPHTINKTIQEPFIKRFLLSVKSNPTCNALWINNKYYSYEQLWQIVLSIYYKIPSDKIYERIGIYCNDDVHTYAGILAIHLYGAAYVPLNKKFPVNRNKKIVEQCELGLIICSIDTDVVNLFSAQASIIFTDLTGSVCHEKPAQEVLYEYKKVNQSIAYILFTSGSTGEPKGVPVSHSNINHFFDYFLKNYNFNADDRFLQVYELTFDVSVFSFFMPLLVGACCYIMPNDEIKFIKILQLLNEHKITVISIVPGILHYMEKYLHEVEFKHLRYSFFSGDALYHDLAVKWKKSIPNGQIHNFYGPTETTIVCTCYPWEESQSEKESVGGIVPLGKPFMGMNALIIDENNLLAEKGELCFSGTQVIAGYLNNRNEDKFFNYESKRYYKTGDIVSCNTNGNFIFHGRVDSQVKINGYRVELREIESSLEQITKTRCIVICSPDKKKINMLTAFVETADLNEKNWNTTLSLLLPDYMLPHQYVAVKNFPVNINQKPDKQALLKLKS